ncbi:MAG: hypothetical protein M1309_06975 [Actinobacteria bacterium]|nr:hypothetical protein [Actinomycetota bacterium]
MDNTTNSTKYRVRRDGKKDLLFTGVLLGSGSDYQHQGLQNAKVKVTAAVPRSANH